MNLLAPCVWLDGKCRKRQSSHTSIDVSASAAWLFETRRLVTESGFNDRSSADPVINRLAARITALELANQERVGLFTSLRFLSVIPNRSQTHHDRQRELLTALSRTCAHPAFRAVHLLVQDLDAVRSMLVAFRYILPQKVKAVLSLGRMPFNFDLVRYAATELRGEMVLASNDDIYPEGAEWSILPSESLALSRHAKVNETCMGCFLQSCNQRRAQVEESLCSEKNFGSFDAWVHRFDGEQLWMANKTVMSLLSVPRHAFGTENLLGHVFERYLGVRLANRCLKYRVFHMHCHFRTSVRHGQPENASVGRGYGQGRITSHKFAQRLLRKHVPGLSSEDAARITRRRWEVEW